MTKIYGVKGFDEDLKCKGFQYKIGEIHEMKDTPKLCGRGFHYCKTLRDVFQFYPNNGTNRYCIIEVMGYIDEGNDKCATNKIRLIRELPESELNGRKTIPVNELKELNDKGYTIGGSLALRIHGYRFDREITDIDLVVESLPNEKIESDFSGYSSINRHSGMDSIYAFIGVLGEKYDVIQSPKVYPVKRVYQGEELTIQDEVEIWSAKLKYALNGSVKHMRDILKNNIQFDMRTRSSNNSLDDDLLPF